MESLSPSQRCHGEKSLFEEALQFEFVYVKVAIPIGAVAVGSEARWSRQSAATSSCGDRGATAGDFFLNLLRILSLLL